MATATPDPVTGISISYNNTEATVTWYAPMNTGGAPIDSYTVTAMPGSISTTVSGTSATLSSLGNGTSYTFSVVAINQYGSSASVGVPGMPTSVAAVSRNGSADLSWVVPSDDGGSAIINYTVTDNNGTTYAASSTSTTITGLTNGTAYTFTVKANNANGSGMASATSNSVTPAPVVPGAPSAVIGTALNSTEIRLTWEAPTNTGGAAITGYSISVSPGARTVIVGNVVETTITGLTAETEYTFSVRAVNSAGTGASASSSSVRATGSLYQWSKLVTSSNNTYANSIASDSSGNVYVTGYASGSGFTLSGLGSYSMNYVWTTEAYAIKYNSSGDPVWATVISNSGTGASEYPQKIYVDSNQNMYITGYTNSSGFTVSGLGNLGKTDSTNDGFVLKYNASGVPQWGQIIKGTGDDYPYSVAVDSMGSVYVVGYTNSSGFTISGLGNLKGRDGVDGFVVKYNNSGVPVWGSIIGASGSYYHDQVNAVIVDSSDNVYIGGFVQYQATFSGFGVSKSGGTNGAFVAKYNMSGAPQWVKLVDSTNADERAIDLKADSSGNVYMLGTTDTSGLTIGSIDLKKPDSTLDNFIVKYDPNGNTLWARLIGGSSTESAVSIMMDSYNNVYALGQTTSSGFTVSGLNVPFVKTGNSTDMYIIKYNKDGNPVNATLLGGYGYQVPYYGTIANNQITIAGYTTTSGLTVNSSVFNTMGEYDAYLIKLTNQGAVDWHKVLGGASVDLAYSISKNSSGRIFIGGSTRTSGLYSSSGTSMKQNYGYSLGIVIETNASGIPIVATSLGEYSQWTTDEVRGIAHDANDNMFIVGTTNASGWRYKDAVVSFGSNTGYTSFLLKQTPSGAVQWNAFVSGISSEYSTGIAVSPSGSVAMTGYTDSPTVSVSGLTLNKGNYYEDGYIFKYTNTGQLQWGALIGGSVNHDRSLSVAIDSQENTYVVGYTETSGFTIPGYGSIGKTTTNRDGYVVKYNASGVATWAQLYAATTTNAAYGVTVDQQNNVYVVGSTAASGFTISGLPSFGKNETSEDGFLVKYNSSGTPVWANIIQGVSNQQLRNVKVDVSGNVYVTGLTAYPTTISGASNESSLKASIEYSQDVFVAKYNSSGVYQWYKHVFGNGTEEAGDMLIETDGSVYIVGSTNGYDFNTVNFTSTQTPILTRLLSPGMSQTELVVSNSLTSTTAFSGYFASQSGETTAQLYLNIRKAMASLALGAAERAVAESRFVSAMRTYHGRSVLDIADASQFAGTLAGTTLLDTTKAIQVALPIYTNGSATFNISASSLRMDGSKQVLFEIPPTCSLTITDSQGNSSTYSNNGTGVVDLNNGQYYKGSYVVIGEKVCSVLADGVLLMKPQFSQLIYTGTSAFTGASFESLYNAKTDASGNVYIVGYTGSSGFTISGAISKTTTTGDAFIAKLNSSGVGQWGDLHQPNVSIQYIAPDNNGNLYVGGRAYRTSWTVSGLGQIKTTLDYTWTPFMLKYNASGRPVWGNGNFANQLMYDQSVSCDNSGNSYLVGFTNANSFTISGMGFTKQDTSNDGVIVAFNPSGAVSWARLVSGPQYELSYSSAVDPQGSLIVASYISSSGFNMSGFPALSNQSTTADGILMKFTASGTPVWNAYITDGSNDSWIQAITTDASGNVYATGYVYTSGFSISGQPAYNKMDTSTDAFVAKYTSAGALDWFKLIATGTSDNNATEYGNAIVVDKENNIYVGGYSTTSGFTISGFPWFNKNNNSQDGFVVRYNPSGNMTYAMLLGNAGTQYVSNMAASESNLYIVGYTGTSGFQINKGTLTKSDWSRDGFITRYDSSGNFLGTTIVASPDDDDVYDTVFDSANNYYVIGYSRKTGLVVPELDLYNSYTMFYKLKYNSLGVPIAGMDLSLSPTFSSADRLAIDSSGNTFIAGYTYQSGLTLPNLGTVKTNSGLDVYVIKQDPSGNNLWYRSFGGAPTSGWNIVDDLTVDANNDVYVAGYTYANNFSVSGLSISKYDTSYNAFIVKFDSAGSTQWGKLIEGSGNQYNYRTAAAYDGVYLAGYTNSAGIAPAGFPSLGKTDTNMDTILLKYSYSGTALWGRLIKNYYPKGLTSDASGNASLTGYTRTSGFTISGLAATTKASTDVDTVVVKYSAAGAPVWSRLIGANNGDEEGFGIAADSFGNVYAATRTNAINYTMSGTITGKADQTWDTLITKFNPSGQILYGKIVGGSGDEVPRTIRVDANGNVALAGTTTTQGFDPSAYSVSPNDAYMIQYKLQGAYTPPAGALAAVTTAITNASGVSDYFVSQSERLFEDVYVELRNAIKASVLATTDDNTVRNQFLRSAISSTSGNVFEISQANRSLFFNSMAMSATTTDKPIQVVLPAYDLSGSATFDIATAGLTFDTSKYIHFELPVNNALTLINGATIKTFSYDGVNLVEGSNTYSVNDTLAVGNKSFKVMALGSFTFENLVAPGAPTAVTASVSAAAGQAVVSWTAPTSNGGADITSYTVSVITGGSTVSTATSSTTSATISGLTNGTSYTFTVSATNIAGTGTASSPSSAVTPYTVADAPTLDSTSSGNATATLNWFAPAFNGGNTVTGYTITASPYITPVTTSGTSATLTQLLNGTTYTFSIVATNARGSSTALTTDVALAAQAPLRPTGVTASVTAAAGQAVVSWTAPSHNGGSAITSYTVTSSSDSNNPSGISVSITDLSGSNVVTTGTVTGLINGTSYTFTVSATNIVGTGSASTASSAVIPYTVPDAPTSVSSSSTNASATITWAAPTFTGGRAITGYTITSDQSTTPVTTTALTYTFTGLTNGTAYVFSVVATNIRGNSSALNFTALTPMPIVPFAPQNVVAAVTANSGEVTVTWGAPLDDGGDAVTSYRVVASSGAELTASDPTQRTVTFTGLNNATQYTFTVYASNTVGEGAASSASNGIYPGTVPTRPTITSTAASGANLTVNWTASSNQSGYSITATPAVKSYPLSGIASSTGIEIALDDSTLGSVGSSVTTWTNAAGITNYDFTNTASGSWVAPTVVAGTVAGTKAVRFNGSNTGLVQKVARTTDISTYTVMLLAKPTALGTNRILQDNYYNLLYGWWGGYTNEFYSDYNAVLWFQNVSGKPTAITPDTEWRVFTFTLNGTALTMRVGGVKYSITGNGNSPMRQLALGGNAGAVNEGTACDVAAVYVWNNRVLSDMEVISYERQLVDKYGVPTSTWNSFGLDTDNGSGIPVTVTAARTATTATLDLGSSFGSAAISMKATNAIGDSSSFLALNSGSSTYFVPGAPTSVSATSGVSGRATVSWTAPTSNGGSVISSYIVSATPSITPVTITGATSGTITGLTNGTSYTFTVAAVNAVGTGASSSPTSSVTPIDTVPDAPTDVTADVSAAQQQAVVSWTAPTNDGGQSISNYTVNVITGGSTVTTASAGTSTSATITGLTNGTSYTFTVTATNSVGTSSASTASSAVIPYTVPGTPSVVSISSTNGSATLSWSAPASNGGRTITDYTITASPSITAITTSSTSYTVTGLTNGTTYTFSVVANNLRGSSSAATFSAVTPQPVAPSAPRSLAADMSVASAQANLSWLAPEDNGGATITQYTVTASRTGAADIVRTTSSTSYAFTGLTNGASYTFTVTATNSAGTSSAVTLGGSGGSGSGTENLNVFAHENGARIYNPYNTNYYGQSPYDASTPGDVNAAWVVDSIILNGNNTNNTNRSTAKSSANVITWGYYSTNNYVVVDLGQNRTFNAAYGYQSFADGHVTHISMAYAPVDTYSGSDTRLYASSATWVNLFTNEYIAKPATVSSSYDMRKTFSTVTTRYVKVTVVDDRSNGGSGWVEFFGMKLFYESALDTATVPYGVPSAVQNLVSETTETSATLSWQAPASNGGRSVTGYTITTSPGLQGAGTSYYFNYTQGTALQVANNAAFRFRTGDFTVEFFLKTNRVANTRVFSFGKYPSSSFQFALGGSTSGYQVMINNVFEMSTNDSGYAWVGNWRHVAISRTSGTLRFFIDGNLIESVSSTSDFNDTTNPLYIGGELNSDYGSTVLDGWVTNFRWITGTGLYTTNFSVPTSALTAVTNTKLLLLGASATDSGPLGLTVSNNNVAIAESSPLPGGLITTFNTTNTTYTFNGLQQATTYTMTVTANNLRGASAGSVVYTTPAGAASAPRNLVVVPLGTGAQLSWRVPETDGGTPITSYKITTVPTTSTTTTTASERSTIITGLSPNTSYQIRVVAVNEKGDGAPATSNIVALATADPPDTVTTSLRNGFVYLEWSRPTDLGNMGGGIISYVVTATPTAGAAIQRTVAVVRELEFTGLTVGETYTFTVATSTTAGVGSASTPTEPILITVSDATTAIINNIASPSSASIASFISNATAPNKDVYLEVKQAIRDAVVTEVITTTTDKNAAKLEMIQAIRQKLVDAGQAQANQNAVITLPSTEVPNFIKAVDAKVDIVFDIPIAVVLPVFTSQAATVALDTLPAGDKYIQLEVPIGYTITLTNGGASKTLVNNGTSLTSGSEVYILGDEIPVGNTYYNVSFFGTVGLHELPGGASFGDPYVTTLSNVNYKLPAMNAPIRFYQGMVGGDLLTVNATLRTIDSTELLGENVTGFNALRSRIPRRAQNALSAALLSKSEELCFFERVYVKYRDSSLTMNLWNGRFQLEESCGKFDIRVRDVEGLLEKHNQYQRGYEGQALEISLGPAKLVLAVYPTSMIRNGICLYGARQILDNGNGVMMNVLGDKDMKLPSLNSLVAVPKVDRPLKSVVETFVDHDGYRKARVNVVRK